MSAIPNVLAEIGSYAFYAIVVALVTGRMGFLALQVTGRTDLASRWAAQFNRYTAYLRP